MGAQGTPAPRDLTGRKEGVQTISFMSDGWFKLKMRGTWRVCGVGFRTTLRGTEERCVQQVLLGSERLKKEKKSGAHKLVTQGGFVFLVFFLFFFPCLWGKGGWWWWEGTRMSCNASLVHDGFLFFPGVFLLLPCFSNRGHCNPSRMNTKTVGEDSIASCR